MVSAGVEVAPKLLPQCKRVRVHHRGRGLVANLPAGFKQARRHDRVFCQDDIGRKAAHFGQSGAPVRGKAVGKKSGFDADLQAAFEGACFRTRRVVEQAGVNLDGVGLGARQLAAIGCAYLGIVKSTKQFFK